MALEQAVWEVLKDRRPATLLCLGYPDLLITDRLDCPVVEDRGIAAWHHWDGPIYETTAALERLGISPVYIDVHPSRGAERVVDLNYPLPADLCGAFDAVLDPGTLEHCFNIGQAFRNVVQALKPGGFAVHTNPLSQANHGFWSINPTAYHDFYGALGFRVETVILGGPVARRERFSGVTTERFHAGPELVNLCVATAPGEVTVAGWPTQTKYRNNPDLKA